MKTVIDQMHRTVEVPIFPIRIVSLVPSQTELLFDLGLGERIVGITKFCIHPNEWFSSTSINAKQRVGGTKNVNFDRIAQLNPDLIIGNKEENSESDIRKLAERYPVWMSDIYTLEDALSMMKELGKLTQTSEKANQICHSIMIQEQLNPITPLNFSCVYLIWNDPIMTVGKNTFIDEMIAKAGLINAIDAERYPTLSEVQLQSIKPDLLLLSSEPFPFNDSHIQHFQKLLPSAKIMIVDGELFSWYGSRLLHSFYYFRKINITQFQK
jgi:ABC-type Fe3+-hydroxamate transport system substrate-binding protein